MAQPAEQLKLAPILARRARARVKLVRDDPPQAAEYGLASVAAVEQADRTAGDDEPS